MKTMFAIPAMVSLALIAVPVAAQVMTPNEYVTTAGGSDQYEITSSQLVLQSTADPKVRQFAQMMIANHTKSTGEVKSAAARSQVGAPPPALNPLQMELIAELQAENGSARDAAYIAQQRASHNQALNVQKAYAMEGTDPALKGAAKKIVPVVESHIAMLMKM